MRSERKQQRQRGLTSWRLGKNRAEVLKDYFVARVTERSAERSTHAQPPTGDRPLILPHHNVRRGERLSYQGIYFAVERIGELAGISDLHPYQFRHSYATNLLLRGLDPSHAKRLTGHQSEKAFRRYTLRSEQEAAIPLGGLRYEDRCLLSGDWRGSSGVTSLR